MRHVSQTNDTLASVLSKYDEEPSVSGQQSTMQDKEG
jgi:hypothetical protein